MVANGALILNFFFTFGILTSFQAALTMSGIAGMVRSLGMAVDANVLIYERTRKSCGPARISSKHWPTVTETLSLPSSTPT